MIIWSGTIFFHRMVPKKKSAARVYESGVDINWGDELLMFTLKWSQKIDAHAAANLRYPKKPELILDGILSSCRHFIFPLGGFLKWGYP